jgi:serine protease
MLQSGMRRFLLPFFLSLAASFAVQAQSPIVAHGLIIQLKPGAQAQLNREPPSASQAKRESLAQERMAAVAQGSGVKNFTHRHLSGDHRLMRFSKPLQGSELEDAMRRLRLHPDVAFVEPNVRVPLAQVPNDTNFALQWHLGSRTGAAAALNMTNTWAITTGTASITVAVLDTGVLRNHPDLLAMGSRLLPGYDFVEDVDNANDGNGRDADASDPGDWVTSAEALSPTFAGCDRADSSWHGSFIIGQIAAATNNSAGIAGINWNANILPVRVSGKCGALLTDILDGMRWAAGLPVAGVPNNANPAKVINLSFGGDRACSASYQTVIDELASRGTLVVVAAGNGTGSQSRQLKRPADCRGVMAVGAVQRDGLKTAYSFVGSNMALMTTGGHGSSASTLLLSADNAGLTVPAVHTYDYKAGTSFSAPLAAGVASLMLAVNPNLTPDALIARMKTSSLPHVSLALFPSCASSDTVACNCTTSVCGAGLLNPQGAVQLAVNPAAVIAAVGSPGVGATVVLDGRASVAVGTPTVAGYAWSQISGPALSLPAANSSVTQVVLPSTAGEFIFKLSVTDTLGRSGEAQLYIGIDAPAASSNTGGGGGGADHWFGLALLALLMLIFLSRFFRPAKQDGQ